MKLFSRLFGKKTAGSGHDSPGKTTMLSVGEQIISAGGNTAYKVIHRLSEEQQNALEHSRLPVCVAPTYMHYWTPGLICTDRNDPAWQNKVMFFWEATEPFPRKSLPPEFTTFQEKYFLFSGDTSPVSLRVGEAIPWFGMPGMGKKHVCVVNEEQVTIPELYEKGLVQYFELVELHPGNFDILTQDNSYFFLPNMDFTPFKDGGFFLDGKPVSLSHAYMIGGVLVARKTSLD